MASRRWYVPQTSRSSHLRQRFEIVARQLRVVSLNEVHTSTDVVDAFQAADHLCPRARAAAAWLICTGRYATEEEQERLETVLDARDLTTAARILDRGYSSAHRRVRSRRLVTVEGPIIDVTRTSLATGITGIPRIVRMLAKHGAIERSTTLVVWASGGPARVVFEPPGNIAYPTEVWGRTRAWIRVLRAGRSGYWSLVSGLSRLPGGATLTYGLRAFLAPFKLTDLGRSNPREILLIPEAGIFEPEVTASRVTDHLIPWLTAFPSTPLTLLVHDTLPLTNPQFFARDQRLEYLDYSRLFGLASCLIIASPHLRREVTGLMAAYGRSSLPRIEVLPFPHYSHTWGEDHSIAVEHPAFYMVGSPERRKNYLAAVTAMRILAEQGSRAELHIIGARRGVQPSLRSALALARQAGASIRLHGPVADAAVAGIARKCLALLYLSKAEGFGLPVREAQSLGCFVIASDIPSNQELARDGGVRLVDHSSPTSIARAMKDLIEGRRLPIRQSIKPVAEVPPDAYARSVTALVLGAPHGQGPKTGELSADSPISDSL